MFEVTLKSHGQNQSKDCRVKSADVSFPEGAARRIASHRTDDKEMFELFISPFFFALNDPDERALCLPFRHLCEGDTLVSFSCVFLGYDSALLLTVYFS